MHGRLNSFQKTMVQWYDLHPYNAVHVVRLSGAVNEERLRHALNARLAQLGLTHLEFDREAGTFRYHGGPWDCPVKFPAFSADPVATLKAEIERQLNTAFIPEGRFSPFRFFVLPATDCFYLGLAYFHPVADAESIVWLLRDLVRVYRSGAEPEISKALNLYPDHRAHLLSRWPGVVAAKLSALPAQTRNLRQSHRPRYHAPQDGSIGFKLFSLPPEHLQRLLARAKSWEVTVNDLLLALLMKSVSPMSVSRAKSAKRNRLSVGCIVNLRRELSMDSARAFGLFLGSFTVTHPLPEGIPLRELAGDIRRQTLAIKQRQLYLATPMELALGRFVLRFFSPERRRTFYQKNYPLWGGLTNMNLNVLWEHSEADGALDYFRGVSTGPVTPLVFSVTTFGGHANVGLSFRRTVFSPEDIQGVYRSFLEHLDQLSEAA